VEKLRISFLKDLTWHSLLSRVLMFPKSARFSWSEKSPKAEENTKASTTPAEEKVMHENQKIYETSIKADVHHRWYTWVRS
jgi:hypothetical protein